MPLDPAIAFQQFLSNTEHFLRTYPLRINGDPTGSGIRHYWLSNWNLAAPQRPGSILRTRNMHATQGFTIDCNRAAGAAHFLAYSINMEQSNVAPIAFYTVPAGGPNILVTGRLSGCSFIVNDVPMVGLQFSHLQPNGETGMQLDARLQGAGYTAVYGRGRYSHLNDPTNPLSYDRNVTIVGTRQNGAWNVYAQKLDMMNSFSIRSVHRIFP